jgi:hypothetical protein
VKNLISKILKEDESFDWISDTNLTMDICQGVESLKPGDIIELDDLPSWLDSPYEEFISGTNIKAEVLDVAPLKKIQPTNTVNFVTILIHTLEDYSGFDEMWARDFANPKHREICSDGRCMYLICGEETNEYRDILITLLEKKDSIKTEQIKEEEDSFDWIKQQKPASKEYIINKIGDKNAYPNHPNFPKFIDKIHKLGLYENHVDELVSAVMTYSDIVYYNGYDKGYDEGVQVGYEEASETSYQSGYDDGFDEGKYEGRAECDEDLEIKWDSGYEEGYDDAKEEWYRKGYDTGTEETYHKAFEEGRAYESGKDVEYYERGESDFYFEDDEELN